MFLNVLLPEKLKIYVRTIFWIVFVNYEDFDLFIAVFWYGNRSTQNNKFVLYLGAVIEVIMLYAE